MARLPAARIAFAPAARAPLLLGTRGTDRLSLEAQATSGFTTLASMVAAAFFIWSLFP